MIISVPVLLLVVTGFVSGLPDQSQNDDSPPYQALVRDLVERYLQRHQQHVDDTAAILETQDARSAAPPKSERTVSKSTTILKARNKMSKRTREHREMSAELQLKLEEVKLRALAQKNEDIMEELLSLEILKRTDTDPNCDDDTTCDGLEVYRHGDGKCNNLNEPLWGSAGIQHLRLLDNEYNNGIWASRSRSVAGGMLPDAREISNAVHKYDGEDTGEETPVSSTVSQMVWSWGQFLSHDIINTPEGNTRDVDCCNETDDSSSKFCMAIEIEAGDSYFLEGICIPAARSDTVFPCDDVFQNQINDVTAYIDASHVYGSSDGETDTLRSFTGGFLIESTRQFPPNDTSYSDDLFCDRQETNYCALTGEARANVVPPLTSLHTLFLREHNRIACYLGKINPEWTDQDIFQETRKIVMAENQFITYNEFLPTFLSASTMAEYRLTTPTSSYEYENETDASVIQAFSIAFRGHSMIPPTMKLLNENYEVEDNNNDVIDLTDTYSHPHYLFWKNYRGIDEIVRGLVGEKCPMKDRFMESSARNELFGEGELAALNIMRGREWGVPPYTKYRSLCGLADGVTDWDWSDLTDHDTAALTALQSVYAHPEDIDLYTGCISETNLDSSMVGPTASCLIGMQFEVLKFGDRFWFETSGTSSDGFALGFTSDQLDQIKNVTLSRILCDNLDITTIQEDAFAYGGDLVDCDDLPSMNLDMWADAGRK